MWATNTQRTQCVGPFRWITNRHKILNNLQDLTKACGQLRAHRECHFLNCTMAISVETGATPGITEHTPSDGKISGHVRMVADWSAGAASALRSAKKPVSSA